LKKPLLEHLDELRKRFIVILVFLFLFFLLGAYFSNLLIEQIINYLIVGNKVFITALSPVEYILTQLKVGILISIILSSPLIFYEFFVFIKPGLKRKEKAAIKMIMPSFVLFFIAGAAFAYFVFLKIAIYFLSNLPIEHVLNLWSINKLISFIFLICFSFGLIFQMPLFLLILNKLNILSIKFLKKQRKVIYVFIFIFTAMITPPDAITLLIMSLPLVVLYEVSLVVLKIV